MEAHILPILILIDNEFDDLEVMYPKLRLVEAGYHVVVAGKERGKTYIGRYGYPCRAEESIFSIHERHFSGVICAGGRAAEELRCEGKIKSLVSEFHCAKKLIATICTGGWVAISAGVFRGKRVTGSPVIHDDLVNAGAILEQCTGVVVDAHIVTGASAADLPAFMKSVLQVIEAQQTNAKAGAVHA